jgi:hypothetical protein
VRERLQLLLLLRQIEAEHRWSSVGLTLNLASAGRRVKQS